VPEFRPLTRGDKLLASFTVAALAVMIITLSGRPSLSGPAFWWIFGAAAAAFLAGLAAMWIRAGRRW